MWRGRDRVYRIPRQWCAELPSRLPAHLRYAGRVWVSCGLLFVEFRGVESENAAPGSGAVEEFAEFLIAFSVPLELAVDEFDECCVGSLGGEVDFDFAGL